MTSAYLPFDPKRKNVEDCNDFYYMNQINPRIWLGSAKSRLYVKEMGITAVISIVSPSQRESRLTKITDTNIIEYPIDLVDHPSANIIDVIYQVTDILNREYEIFLVHCIAGKSRSPSALIGYFMLIYGIDYHEAFEMIFMRRPCIRPNPGFREQLQSDWIPSYY